MDNFTKGKKKGGFKKSFGGGSRGGSSVRGGSSSRGSDRAHDRDSQPVTMHSGVCGSCKKTCEVPFRPTGDRPVYCRDCFAGRAAMGGDRSQRKDFRNDTRSFGTPSYSRMSSENAGSAGNSGNDEMKKQIEMVSYKLDKLVMSVEKLTEVLTNKNG